MKRNYLFTILFICITIIIVFFIIFLPKKTSLILNTTQSDFPTTLPYLQNIDSQEVLNQIQQELLVNPTLNSDLAIFNISSLNTNLSRIDINNYKSYSGQFNDLNNPIQLAEYIKINDIDINSEKGDPSSPDAEASNYSISQEDVLDFLNNYQFFQMFNSDNSFTKDNAAEFYFKYKIANPYLIIDESSTSSLIPLTLAFSQNNLSSSLIFNLQAPYYIIGDEEWSLQPISTVIDVLNSQESTKANILLTAFPNNKKSLKINSVQLAYQNIEDILTPIYIFSGNFDNNNTVAISNFSFSTLASF